MAAAGGARQLALTFMRSAAHKGMSFAATFRELKAGGLATYRRTSMLSDFRELAGMPAKGVDLGKMRYDYRPSRESYSLALQFQHQDFRYEVTVDIYKPQTNETFTMATNVTSDYQLTRRQMQEMAFEGIKGSMDRSEFEIRELRPSAAIYREGVAWQ